MKTITTLIAIALSLSGATSAQDIPDIYLLIGQSNMAGRAPFTEKEAAPIKGCFLLNGEDKWEPAKNPLNAHSTIRKGLNVQKMSPGYHFSIRMLGKGDATLGLVVNAKGGTRIEEWGKGTKFYKEAVRRTQAALKEGGTLKGILWHQGESNEKNPEGYLEKLKALVEDLRQDLDSPELPFVAGQVQDVQPINDQIAKLPETVPHTAYVSSDGLRTMDRWHFDAPSMKLLGERYADEMLKLQEAE